MTSSPGPIPNAATAVWSAAVPDDTANEYFTPIRLANSFSNAAVLAGAGLGAVAAAYSVSVWVHAAMLAFPCFSGTDRIARLRITWDRDTVLQLLRFGGWGTLSTLLYQALIETDRWVVGTLGSLTQLGH